MPLVGRLVGGVVLFIEEAVEEALVGVLLIARGSVLARLSPSVRSAGFDDGGVSIVSLGDDVDEVLWKCDER